MAYLKADVLEDMHLAAADLEEILTRLNAENEKLGEDIKIQRTRRDYLANSSINKSPIIVDENHNPNINLSAEGNKELLNISQQKQICSALNFGVENVMAIKLSDIKIKVDGFYEMKVFIQSIIAVIHLNVDKAVVDIEILQWFTSNTSLYPVPEASVVVPRLILEAMRLQSPQDLRHILFCLSAIQTATIALNNDILAVRQRCLLHAAGYDEVTSSLQLQATFSNGVSVEFHVHLGYSSVPNGVHINSMMGVGGWSPQSLDSIRRRLNKAGMRTVNQAVDCILLELGSNQ